VSHCIRQFVIFSLLLIFVGTSTPAMADPVIAPAFQNYYTIRAVLGAYPLYPFGGAYTGMAFSPFDPNTLLIGAQVTESSRGIVPATLARDATGHINGFSGITGHFAYASKDVTTGLAFGPNGVLFATAYPDNLLYQYKPGNYEIDKTINLAPSVAYSTGSVEFVPAGYPGAGGIRFTSGFYGQMYKADLTADGNGTFNVSNITEIMSFGGDTNPQQLIWVPSNSLGFSTANQYVLVDMFGSQRVSAFQLDANSTPNFATQAAFLTGLVGVVGAAIDPLTGDFLFSTYGPSGAGDHIYVVSRIGASSQLTGDYNHNGVVDAADYVVWRKGLGTTYTQPDYDVWRAHFGQTVGSGAGASVSPTVPEPAACALLMFAAAGWCFRRGCAA
jgi:hypothetical protein